MQIQFNHLGYLSNQNKYAIISNDSQIEPSPFTLKSESGETVYTGVSSQFTFDSDSGDWISYADFSDFSHEGQFQIESNLITTPLFKISSKIFGELAISAMRWFYLQRSGADKNDPITGISHKADLTQRAIWWGPEGIDLSKTFDLRGGWWDAGDYGRYIPPAASVVTMLLLSYAANPTAFPDGSLTIPESGNGENDLLSEVTWELNWMLSMQREDGAFHHKLTFKNYPIGLPDTLEDDLYLFDVSSQATSQAVGALGFAAMIFKSIDPEYAQKLHAAAIRGGNWLAENPEIYPEGGFDNPVNVDGVQAQGGPYAELYNFEYSVKFFAQAGLFCATGDNKYSENAAMLFKKLPSDEELGRLSWSDGWGFGAMILLMNEQFQGTFRETILNRVVSAANVTADCIDSTGYRIALSDSLNGFNFTWGSHPNALGRVFFMLLTDRFAPNPRYKELALCQLNWICGINPIGIFHCTGEFSHNGVKTAHHQWSWTTEKLVPGMITEGPNNQFTGGDVPLNEVIAAKTPAARCFVDHVRSYASNEPTIYANGSFVGAVSFFL